MPLKINVSEIKARRFYVVDRAKKKAEEHIDDFFKKRRLTFYDSWVEVEREQEEMYCENIVDIILRSGTQVI